jgi:hypothetical protein
MKFIFNQKVKITAGFYKGMWGYVKNVSKRYGFFGKTCYYIRTESGCPDLWVDENELEIA